MSFIESELGHTRKVEDFQLTKEQQAQMAQFQKTIWVNYPLARSTVIQLSRMITFADQLRPECALILGNTGSGKTLLAKKLLLEMVRQHKYQWEDFLFVTMPASVRGSPVKSLLREILRGLNHDLSKKISVSEGVLQTAVRNTLFHANLKAIIFDEAHHIVRSDTMRTLEGIAEELKAIQTFARAPLFLIGTPSLKKVILFNSEVRNRFSAVFELPPLTEEVFPSFVANVETLYTNVDSPSLACDSDAVSLLFNLSEGCIATTVRLVKNSIITSVFEGADKHKITRALIKRTIARCRYVTE